MMSELNDHINQIKLIFKLKDVNLTSDFYMFYHLCENNYHELIKELINNGFDVNIKTKYGYTTLMWASINGNIETIKLLLDNGADVNIQNINGYTALSYGVSNKHAKIIKLLKEHGAK